MSAVTTDSAQRLPPGEPVLTVAGVGKTYTVPVLAGVDLTLNAGEVLALTGENGAGKSTLSKIISGLVAASGGVMHYRGQPYAPASRGEAEALGVRMVMQELNLLPTLTIAENLFLNRLPAVKGIGWISRKRLREDARVAMARVGLESLDPDALVSELGIGHQQLVEIARNLIGDCRVLILDEPTAMLTGREVDLLFHQVERLKRDGVSIVYISHRLEELARIADRVAVLRDGRLVSVGPIADYSTDRLVAQMVGRDLGETIDFGAREIGAPMLRVDKISAGAAVKDVSFTVHSGEIFGISGLIGSGRTELLRAIFGADPKDCGTVSIGAASQPAPIRSPTDAVRQGMALITEDRKSEGLMLPQSIASNIALNNFDAVSRFGWIDGGRERTLAKRHIEAMRIRCSGPQQAVGELSGGNQQKVVIGRWLERDADVLLFDEPTRGIDVGAKFEIYALLGEEAKKGKALVVVSSELRELMLICDRIGVMSAGQMVRIFARDEWTQDDLLAAAFSGYAKRDALLTREAS